MKRSFFAGALILIHLVGCKEAPTYRAVPPFVFTVLKNAVVTNGKDTVSRLVEPLFAVNDLVPFNGKRGCILQMDSTSMIKHIILSVPVYYITESSKDPDAFEGYRSGDTLILNDIDGLSHPYLPLESNVYQDAKRSKAINLQTGEAICIKVDTTVGVGDPIQIGSKVYKIVELEPYTDLLEVELPEEIQGVSTDPAHPDRMQVYSKGDAKIFLGYTPNK